MPSRSYPFVTGKAYHIYDKTLDRIRIFEDIHCCEAFIEALAFYRFHVPNVSLSAYRRFNATDKQLIRQTFMHESDALVTIHAFVLMPNHFHLLIRQKKEGGVVQFMGNVMNSITRYHNRRYRRKGPVLLPRFSSVRIVGVLQLSFVSRYIHRNPLKARLVKDYKELLTWKYSSLPQYVEREPFYEWVRPRYVLRSFNYSSKMYQKYMVANEI